MPILYSSALPNLESPTRPPRTATPWSPPQVTAHPFDRIAGIYRWAEGALFGSALQQCRTHELWNPLWDSAPPGKILLVGDGDGRFLVQLAQRFPNSEIVFMDISPKMVALAQARLAQLQQSTSEPVASVRFFVGNALLWRGPTREYDLLITHFFMDCFSKNTLELLIPTLTRSLKPSAHWWITDFHVPARGWKKWRSLFWTWALYQIFRPITQIEASRIVPLQPLLTRNGLRSVSETLLQKDLLTSMIWKLETEKHP